MKARASLVILLAASIVSANASDRWQLSTLSDGGSRIYFEPNGADPTPPSLQELLKVIDSLGEKTPEGLGVIDFITFFREDPNIQKELLAEFSRNHAQVLAAAKASAGNMHNPKVLPLHAVFEEAMLATPTIRKIDERLRAVGASISGVSFEKLWLEKNNDPLTFHAFVWLKFKPKPESDSGE